jgi:polyferredoxin
MASHELLFLLACALCGLLTAPLFFWLSIFYYRSNKVLKDKPPPSKQMHALYLIFSLLLALGLGGLVVIFSKRVSSTAVQAIGGVIYFASLFGLQFLLDTRFRKKLEERGILESPDKLHRKPYKFKGPKGR